MKKRRRRRREIEPVPLPIWQELLAGVEFVYLRLSPVFWGYGIPRGDGAGVVLIPGFLGTDFYLRHFHEWLRRIGYRVFHSGIALNAECPNLLIRRHLTGSLEKAYAATGRRVHLIGHSLGGMIACAAAAQMPDRVQSVITLGTPVQKLACHPSILRAADLVRTHVLERHGTGVLPDCYTGACTCDFLDSVDCRFPASIRQTSIYTKMDGVVDWRVCRTGDPRVDVEVSATHMGLVFSPLVYSLVAGRLAGK